MVKPGQLHGPNAGFLALAYALLICGAWPCAAQSAASGLVGVWQDRGSTLTFSPDGAAIGEIHIPGHRDQLYVEPQRGAYTVEGNRVRIEWRAAGTLPARQQTCTFSREESILRLR